MRSKAVAAPQTRKGKGLSRHPPLTIPNKRSWATPFYYLLSLPFIIFWKSILAPFGAILDAQGHNTEGEFFKTRPARGESRLRPTMRGSGGHLGGVHKRKPLLRRYFREGGTTAAIPDDDLLDDNRRARHPVHAKQQWTTHRASCPSVGRYRVEDRLGHLQERSILVTTQRLCNIFDEQTEIRSIATAKAIPVRIFTTTTVPR
ncbi:unnamed protein product [Ectocarpus sp. 6 AP-2014]